MGLRLILTRLFGKPRLCFVYNDLGREKTQTLILTNGGHIVYFNIAIVIKRLYET